MIRRKERKTMERVHETEGKKKVKSKENIRFWTITAVFVALTYLFTACINVRLPIAANGGLIHLGNIPLFIGAIIFGKKTGMLAGGIGMGLFDLLSGWTLWAPFTLVIAGSMGFVVGKLTEKPSHQKFVWYAAAVAAALGIKIGGYYVAEGLIYGNWIAPAASIPGNVLQVVLAGAVTLLIVGRLHAAAFRVGLKE